MDGSICSLYVPEMADAEYLAACREFVAEVLADKPFRCAPPLSLIEGLQMVERLEGMVLAGAATECARRLARVGGLPVPAFGAPPAPWLRSLSDRALAQWLALCAAELAADAAPRRSNEVVQLLLGVAHLLDLDPVIAA